MVWKRILVLLLSLAVVLAFVGCGEEDVPGEMTAEEIVAAMMEAADDIETMQLDMDMAYDMSVTGDESFDLSMPATMTGLVDAVNEKMKMDMEMTIDLPPEEGGPMYMDMEMYMIGETMYMKMEMTGFPADWMKMEMPEGYWEEMSQLEQQLDLLEFAQVELLGSETINGTDCYILKIEPDIEDLWEMITQQPGMSDMMSLGLGELDFDLGEIITSMSMTEWVAKDTFFPIKDEMQMVMEMDSEALDLPPEEGEFNMVMDLDMELNYSNYNEPVSIELPSEAEDAQELPFFE